MYVEGAAGRPAGARRFMQLWVSGVILLRLGVGVGGGEGYAVGMFY